METIEQLKENIAAKRQAKAAAYDADLAAIRAEMAPYVECGQAELRDHKRLQGLHAGYLADERQRCELLAQGGFDVTELTNRVHALAQALSEVMTKGTREALAEIAELTPDHPSLPSTMQRLKRTIDLVRGHTFRSNVQSCINALEQAKNGVRKSPIVAHGSPLESALPDPNPSKPKVIKKYDLHGRTGGALE